MKKQNTMRRLIVIVLLLLLCVGVASAQRRKRSKAHAKKHSTLVAEAPETDEDLPQDDRMRLKFSDGTDAIVDDAGENENGFWYTRSGITYLISRDRVKSISRPQTEKQAPAPPIAKVAVVSSAEANLPSQPVWIYLVGGARVEADSANESTSGVWYRRGLADRLTPPHQTQKT
jgi:hypothetical protein